MSQDVMGSSGKSAATSVRDAAQRCLDHVIEHVSSAYSIMLGACTRYGAYKVSVVSAGLEELFICCIVLLLAWGCTATFVPRCCLLGCISFHVFFEGLMPAAPRIEDAADQEAEDKAVSEKCTLLRTRLGGLPEEDRQFGDQDFLHFFDVCCVFVKFLYFKGFEIL